MFDVTAMTALRSLGCALLVLALTVVPIQAQTTVTVQPGSEFWIEGSSSVNTFTCRVDTAHGKGRLADAPARDSAMTAAEPQASIRVPVRRFDCGRAQMTRDLKDALNAEEHPAIRFRLHQVEDVVRPDTSEHWHRLNVLGYLTISGTERLVRASAWGRALPDSTYRISGCKAIDMTYFGIEPPTKFFGAVKVHNRIEVHFDLIAAASVESARSATQHSTLDSSNNLCKANL